MTRGDERIRRAPEERTVTSQRERERERERLILDPRSRRVCRRARSPGNGGQERRWSPWQLHPRRAARRGAGAMHRLHPLWLAARATLTFAQLRTAARSFELQLGSASPAVVGKWKPRVELTLPVLIKVSSLTRRDDAPKCDIISGRRRVHARG